MSVNEVEVKSILRKHKRVESWFLTRYGMNLYRGCLHNCLYCDGRSEKYNVDGEFGKDIAVKINAIKLLERELSPKRKRKPFRKGFIMVGSGGVGDGYQSIEKKYQLTRKALHLVSEYDFAVHILTKSTLVKRDIDILKKINEKKKVIISFSLSSTDDKISGQFEPKASSASERLSAIKFFKDEGIASGVYLMPVIPFITDTHTMMEDTIKKIKEADGDFIIFGGMTLKEGRQKDFFIKALSEIYPDLLTEYEVIYKNSGKWGNAVSSYYKTIGTVFNILAKKYQIPQRIPPYIYKDIVDENDLVCVMLEHIDYLLKAYGRKSPYGYASYSISQLDEPVSSVVERGEITKLKGVGQVTERLVREILKTKDSKYLQKLLKGNV